MKGLLPNQTMPSPDTSDDGVNTQAQTMEAVLKKKREKIASDRLGIAPEEDTSV